jgi:hypothetical protein
MIEDIRHKGVGVLRCSLDLDDLMGRKSGAIAACLLVLVFLAERD